MRQPLTTPRGIPVIPRDIIFGGAQFLLRASPRPPPPFPHGQPAMAMAARGDGPSASTTSTTRPYSKDR